MDSKVTFLMIEES